MEPYPEPVPAQTSLVFPLPARTASEPGARTDYQPVPLHLRQAPLAAAALAFALGIAVARLVYQPASVLLAALGLLVLLSLLSLGKALRVAMVPALVVWTVLGLLAAEWPRPAAAPATLIPFADGLSRDLLATVIRVRPLPPAPIAAADADRVAPWEAAESSPGDSRAAFTLDLAIAQIEEVTPDRSRMVPASGGLRLTVYTDRAAAPSLGCGDRIRLTTRIGSLQRFRDPGAWQYADYLAAQGIDARGNASAADLQRLGPGPPTPSCRLQAAQSWASGRFRLFVGSRENQGLPDALRLSDSDAAIVSAMLFGDRTGLNQTLRTSFERTGSFHLFVVSGLHIALLAGVVFFLARRLHAPDWLATLVTLPVATAYAVFSGFGAPVQRSLAMITVYLLARLLNRERSSLNALGAAVLAMLLWSPPTLFDAGFQMTLLAVIAIAGMAHPLAQHLLGGYAQAAKQVFAIRRHTLPPRLAQLRLTLELFGVSFAAACTVRPTHPVRKLPALVLRAALALTELILIGIVAELVMVLPMAIYFHRATPFALPANMLVIPLVGVLAPAAVLTFAASLLSPAIASVPGAVLAFLLHSVTSGVTHLGSIQSVASLPVSDLRVPGPMLSIALLALALWLAGCWAVRSSRLGAFLTAVALPLIAAMVLWPEPIVRTPGTLEVTALDVGQGDSILVVSPSGTSMLVDAGGPIGSHGVSEIVSRFDMGEEVVSPYLWSRRIRRLDIVVLSHAHTDHMGGMPSVLENFRPRELWVGIDPHSPLYNQLLAEAARLGITVRHFHAGEHLAWSGLPVTVLAPEPGYTNPGAPKNDDSLVLRMSYGKASVLLEGDAERPSEQAMIAAGLVQPVTLLKVGHHGSNTSSTPDFLAAAAPHAALLSSGAGNPFGHPRAEVIGRFAALGIPLLRTDREGLSTVFLTPDGHFREAVQGNLFPNKNPD